MEYKKLKTNNNDEKQKMKLELKGKMKEQQKALKRYRLRSKIIPIISCIIFILVFSLTIVVIQSWQIANISGFIHVLFMSLKVILYIAAFIISILLAFIPYHLVLYDKIKRTYIKEYIDQARRDYTKVHRDFYGLPDDYIITACYQCFDKEFTNKTVCLFRKNNKFCFTVDIVNGFINQECDKGLYEIADEEFVVEKTVFDGKEAYKVIISNQEVIFAKRARRLLYPKRQSNK